MSSTSTPPGAPSEQDLLTDPAPDSELANSAAPPPIVPTDPNAPLTFVPHTPEGAVSGKPVRIRTGRYGVLEEHELVRLLDTIEDERARGRFRESVYISVFVWLAIAWVVLYGPRYLWHAPRIKLASDVLRERELATISLPPAPRIAPPAPPRVDNSTLERLRTMTREAARHVTTPAPPRTPAPTPPSSLPNAPTPAANLNQPPPPNVQPAPSRLPTPAVADAPTPQPSTRPSFNSGGGTPAQQMRQALGNGPSYGRQTPTPVIPLRGGSNMGSGINILSDTQGVDFSHWLRRSQSDLERTWSPLLPDEIYPPLLRTGQTVIRVTILPDGTIGDMKMVGSTHDVAIDKSAWGAIVTEVKFPPLPTEFHGPNLIIDIHFSVEHESSVGQ